MNRELDIRLLRAIHILVTCKSVTKTAEVLGVSPGAVSYLLGKARSITGSTLFVRTKDGMIPDNVAKEISTRYKCITEEYYSDSGQMELSGRDITISTYSLLELFIGLKIRNTQVQNTIHFLPPDMDANERLKKLRNKEVDIDIGTQIPNDKSILSVKFFSCGVKVIARKEHPTINGEITLDDWRENKHVIWSRGMNLICENYQHANEFNSMIEERDASLISSNSTNILLFCALSNDLIIMPENIANVIISHLPVVSYSPPKQLNMRFECYLHYHRSHAKNETINMLLATLCSGGFTSIKNGLM